LSIARLAKSLSRWLCFSILCPGPVASSSESTKIRVGRKIPRPVRLDSDIRLRYRVRKNESDPHTLHQRALEQCRVTLENTTRRIASDYNSVALLTGVHGGHFAWREFVRAGCLCCPFDRRAKSKNWGPGHESKTGKAGALELSCYVLFMGF
jgi:hypothetical protein